MVLVRSAACCGILPHKFPYAAIVATPSLIMSTACLYYQSTYCTVSRNQLPFPSHSTIHRLPYTTTLHYITSIATARPNVILPPLCTAYWVWDNEFSRVELSCACCVVVRSRSESKSESYIFIHPPTVVVVSVRSWWCWWCWWYYEGFLSLSRRVLGADLVLVLIGCGIV